MSMERCMNAGCEAAGVPGGGWRKGWLLRSGGFAYLCDKCGLAYEQLVFCDIFHQKESGWRGCAFCGKRLHCGCIASKSMLELLDGGGVQCLSCSKNFGNCVSGESIVDTLPQNSERCASISARCSVDEKMSELGVSGADGSSELQATSLDHIVNDDVTTKCNVIKLARNTEVFGYSTVILAQGENTNGLFGLVKPEQVMLPIGELGRPGCSAQEQGHIGLMQNAHKNDSKYALKNNPSNLLSHGYFSMSMGGQNLGKIFDVCSNAGAQQILLPHGSAAGDARDQNKILSKFQNVQRPRHVLPKLPKVNLGVTSDAAKELVPQMRVARPPAEGRGRNQLLPRYWPRITDQELRQISGNSNSTIVPLFEKVLSASDAGRIGRLVLPKACAEAYFPPISQPEGLPLKIQDVKGKDWHFQFRFWPNNNSRMYVLEGVTPCIQSLQLQAGDTVTFSRIDPEGKLVMGFRKATDTVQLQESQISAMANGALGSEAICLGFNESLSIVSSYLLKPMSHFPKNLYSSERNVSFIKTDKRGSWVNEGLFQPLLVSDKRSRSIGSKSKRLLMDNEDAMELKLTWEEAQDLLRPPPKVKPSIVIIEDQEFEEYEEPPVIGKRSFFTARSPGEHDQWIQCDDCFKWRRIPLEVLPPPKWTCADNTWDAKRSSCAVPDELPASELQALLQQHAEIKRRRIISSKHPSAVEATGLDALATAAVLGDVGTQATPSVAATTRHPRHRPGCTCIVCIQPPSGKGPKHSPTCICNVCTTVKRRFKTLMMKKKKRQSEREEADANKRPECAGGEELEGNGSSYKGVQATDSQGESEVMESLDVSKGHIDLNCRPRRHAEQQAAGSSRVSMMSLLQVASLPLEVYLKQNKLAGLATSEQQVSMSPADVPQAPMGSESGEEDEHCVSDAFAS